MIETTQHHQPRREIIIAETPKVEKSANHWRETPSVLFERGTKPGGLDVSSVALSGNTD
jgi:hypothetical protein